MTDFARHLAECATFQVPGHFLTLEQSSQGTRRHSAPHNPQTMLSSPPLLAMAGLMQRLRFSERFPTFQVIIESVDFNRQRPQSGDGGFQVVQHDTPIEDHAGQGVFCLASLLNRSQPYSLLAQILHTLARWEKRSLSAVGLDWFDAYWHCAVEPALILFDHHGVALENRQQNSLLRLVDGYPDTYFHRDHQGFYLDQQQKHKLLKWQPTLSDNSELFYPTDIILDGFGHSVLIDQLFAVVDRFKQGGVISEVVMIEFLREKLDALRLTLTGHGRVLIERWLTQTQLPVRGRVHVEGLGELEAEFELASSITIKNPLFLD